MEVDNNRHKGKPIMIISCYFPIQENNGSAGQLTFYMQIWRLLNIKDTSIKNNNKNPKQSLEELIITFIRNLQPNYHIILTMDANADCNNEESMVGRIKRQCRLCDGIQEKNME